MTDAVVALKGGRRDERDDQEVVLVNRDRITKTEPHSVVPVFFAGRRPRRVG